MSTGKNHEAQFQRRKRLVKSQCTISWATFDESLVTWGNNRGVSVERGLQLFQRIPGAEFHLLTGARIGCSGTKLLVSIHWLPIFLTR